MNSEPRRRRVPVRHHVALVVCLLMLAAAAGAQTGRLNGVVRDLDGRPIKGATIVAENVRAEPHLFTVATDERGRFVITGLQGGTWHFIVSAPGYAQQELDEDISARGKTPVEIRLPRATPAIPGSPGSINARQVQADLQAAEALLQGGQYDQAIAAYEAVLTRAPGLTTVYLQIGNAWRLKKDYDRAIAAYGTLLASEPANARATVALALAYRDKGDLKAAEDTLTTAASGKAATSEVFCALGDLRFDQHQMDEAAAWYQKAVAMTPAWTKPLYKLGLVASEKGDKAKAIEQMEKVIAADPNSPDAAAARVLIEKLRK